MKLVTVIGQRQKDGGERVQALGQLTNFKTGKDQSVAILNLVKLNAEGTGLETNAIEFPDIEELQSFSAAAVVLHRLQVKDIGNK